MSRPPARLFPASAAGRPLLGISACLGGENVRYDGVALRHDWIVGTLARHVRLVPLCPEVAIGMGVPREPIRLVQHGNAVRAEGVRDSRLDVTAPLAAYGVRMAETHAALCGYLFKARSPSCGPAGVPLFRAGSALPGADGGGVYAAQWQALRPELPVEEEGALGDPERWDRFVEGVFALHRWRTWMRGGATAERMRGFHAAHRNVLLTRGRLALEALERRVARMESEPGTAHAAAGTAHAASRTAHAASGTAHAASGTAASYLLAFMEIVRRPAGRRGHLRALTALAAPLKLDRASRRELSAALEAFRRGQAPRLVPLTLLRHHLRRADEAAWRRDAYLNPLPHELALRGGM